MERIAIAVAIVVVVALVAVALERRRSADAPTQPKRWPVPRQLDRIDFDRPDAPWLLVAFTSTSCETCARIVAMARPMDSPQLAVQVVPYQERKDLHERYGIEAVPCVVLADASGVASVGFVGSTISATDLWAAVAEAREPGTSPEPHLGRIGGEPPAPA